MSDSEYIVIDVKRGTLTIQMTGKDPLVVINGDDDVRATDYAKILRPGILAEIVDHIKGLLAEESLNFSGAERGDLSKLLKVFELELSKRKSN